MATRAEGRLVAIGDDVLAPVTDHGPGCVLLVAARLGVRAWSLAEEGATARTTREEQLPLAVAMRPARALVSVGTAEALRHLPDAALGNTRFVGRLLAEVETIAATLRRTGARVVLVRPPTLDAAPAAWIHFGRRAPAHATPRVLRPALRNLALAARAWRAGLDAIAGRHAAAVVDLSLLFDDLLADPTSEIGLPPGCGGPRDLFADPVRLSVLGAELAAARLLPALGGAPPPSRWREAAPATALAS